MGQTLRALPWSVKKYEMQPYYDEEGTMCLTPSWGIHQLDSAATELMSRTTTLLMEDYNLTWITRGARPSSRWGRYLLEMLSELLAMGGGL